MPLSISIPRPSFRAPSTPSTIVTDANALHGHADPIRPPLSSGHAHSSRRQFSHGGYAIPPVPTFSASPQHPPGTAALFVRHLDHQLNGCRRCVNRGNSPTHVKTPGARHSVNTLEELFMNLKHRHPRDRAVSIEAFRTTLNDLHEVYLLQQASQHAASAQAQLPLPMNPKALSRDRDRDRDYDHLLTPALSAAPTTLISGNPDFSTHITDLLQHHMLQYATSEDIDSKWAVVSAIDILLSVHPEPEAKAAVRLGTTLMRIIPNNDYHIMADVARLYARIAHLPGMLALVNTDIAHILEWLEDSRSERKRLGAVFLVMELMNRPTSAKIVRAYAPRALEDLWEHALTDTKQEVRDAGRCAIEACLQALQDDVTGPQSRHGLLRIAIQAMHAAGAEPAKLHAGALACCALAKLTPANEGNIVQAIWQPLLDVRDKDATTNTAILEFIVLAAMRDSQELRTQWQTVVFSWLAEMYNREKEQIVALQATAKLLPLVGIEAMPHLDAIVSVFSSGLLQSQTGDPVRPALLAVVGSCARTFGQRIEPHMKAVLERMFSEGLSRPLIDAAADIVSHMPTLAFDVKMRLLDLCAAALTGRTFRQWADPGYGNAGSTSTKDRCGLCMETRPARPSSALVRRRSNSILDRARRYSVSPKRKESSHIHLARSTELKHLALATLQEFDLSGVPTLIVWVQQHIVPRTQDVNEPELRIAALKACSGFLLKSEFITGTISAQNTTVRGLAHTILYSAVSDKLDTVRFGALSLLTSEYDAILTDPDATRTLLFSLHDESTQVRLGVLSILGRLLKREESQSAVILPVLRNELTGALTMMNQMQGHHQRTRQLQLISHLVEVAPTLASLYGQSIGETLLVQLATADADDIVLAAHALLRHLCVSACDAVKLSGAEFVKRLIPSLKDHHNPIRRRSAVTAFAALMYGSACMDQLIDQRDEIVDILLSALANEVDSDAKILIVRAIGNMGAIRPDHSRLNNCNLVIQEITDGPEEYANAGNLEAGLISSNPDDIAVHAPRFIADWLIGQLLELWSESEADALRFAVVEALLRIFRESSSRECSVSWVEQISARFLVNIGDPAISPAAKCFFISALSGILGAIGHLRSLNPRTIVDILIQQWDNGLEPVNCIVDAVSTMISCMSSDFKQYLPLVVPRISQSMTRVGQLDSTILSGVRFFARNASILHDWTQIVIPALIHSVQTAPLSITRQHALQAIGIVASHATIGPYLSRLLPAVVSLCSDDQLCHAAMQCLCVVIKEAGPFSLQFAELYTAGLPFTPSAHPYFVAHVEGQADDIPMLEGADEEIKIITCVLDEKALEEAFASPDVGSDWDLWLTNLCEAVIKHCSNHHIRASAAVAALYQPLQRKLLNYGAYIIWQDLSAPVLTQITTYLKMTLIRNDATPEAHNAILSRSLIDFLDRMGLDIGVEPKLRMEVARRRRFIHRAVRYAELEFEDLMSSANFQDCLDEPFDLIMSPNFDGKLAASSSTERGRIVANLLAIEEEFQGSEPDHAEGLMQLNSREDFVWTDVGALLTSLKHHDGVIAADPNNKAAVLGTMRTLHALQEWDLLLDFGRDRAYHRDATLRMQCAPLIAVAAWRTGKVDAMQSVIKDMAPAEQAWYSAVAATIQHDHALAQEEISGARFGLAAELVEIRGAATGRAYSALVRAQLLSELEEAGVYQRNERERPLIKELWSTRLSLLQKDDDILSRCLNTHSLVLAPTDNVQNVVEYARILRKAGRKALAFKIQSSISSLDSSEILQLDKVPPNEWPGLTLERCRLAYDLGERTAAQTGLSYLADALPASLHAMKATLSASGKPNWHEYSTHKEILARVLRCLGDYHRNTDIPSLQQSQRFYERSAELWANAKGFRKLANVNVSLIETMQRGRGQTTSPAIVEMAISVVMCYIEIISRADNYPLQDVLGLLTIAFKHGQDKRLHGAIEQAFERLEVDCWLEAIPQLCAQLNYPALAVKAMLEGLMQRLAKAHPHTMLSSLSAVAQYPSPERAEVAQRLLDAMRLYDNELVSEALLVNHELLRCSMTWDEKCCHQIEAASKFLFNGDGKNVTGLLMALNDMCKEFSRPQTSQECEFVAKMGTLLESAQMAGSQCGKAESTDKDLANMWRKWHYVHKVCTAAYGDAKRSFNLADVSPALARARNMRASVPGTYIRHAGEDILIAEFNGHFDILPSKQRPRKLTMKGSDGKTYRFLLKAREDLRMDERCGQLFVLVNSLLASDHYAVRRHLRIARYAVIPLSHHAGLCSWFERGDTLQTLCRVARRLQGSTMELELRKQANYAPGIVRGMLTSMQAVEVFQLALEMTKGDELALLLWRKSSSCISWLERRLAYARSLATNSMVGHLLGLGDRHPSNILMDRRTGEIVQIDFGDCFEVAMERESFPEKMPFRLTRQLIRGLGPTGVNGNYRVCSQHTMRVMRANKESIEAVFSSFLYDPLLTHMVLHPRQLLQDYRSSDELPHIGQDESAAPLRTRFSNRRRHTESGNPGVITRLSPRAEKAIGRVRQKLEGTEFSRDGQPIEVADQVARLFMMATDVYALSSSYQGWCPFW